MQNYSSYVKYENGKAQVQFGNRTFTVTRRDTDDDYRFCPIELVVGALGSWITLTISAVADHKGIRVDKIDVHIDYLIGNTKPQDTYFKVRIDLGTGLTRRERTILFNVARSCEVYKMLTGKISFDYSCFWVRG